VALNVATRINEHFLLTQGYTVQVCGYRVLKTG